MDQGWYALGRGIRERFWPTKEDLLRRELLRAQIEAEKYGLQQQRALDQPIYEKTAPYEITGGGVTIPPLHVADRTPTGDLETQRGEMTPYRRPITWRKLQLMRGLIPLAKAGLVPERDIEGLGLEMPEEAPEYTRFFERPGGIYGVTKTGGVGRIPGIPTKPTYDIDKLYALYNLFRLKKPGDPVMEVLKEELAKEGVALPESVPELTKEEFMAYLQTGQFPQEPTTKMAAPPSTPISIPPFLKKAQAGEEPPQGLPPGVDIKEEIKRAQEAIEKGHSIEGIRKMFKQRTGQEFPR
jgi:hypothetical protein